MYLTKKIKQNKKAKVRNLSEKWRKVRWDEALISWTVEEDTHKGKKVEEWGRQHKMTKMKGNLKLSMRRVEIEEYVWPDVCGWENIREKKKKKKREWTS